MKLGQISNTAQRDMFANAALDSETGASRVDLASIANAIKAQIDEAYAASVFDETAEPIKPTDSDLTSDVWVQYAKALTEYKDEEKKFEGKQRLALRVFSSNSVGTRLGLRVEATNEAGEEFDFTGSVLLTIPETVVKVRK